MPLKASMNRQGRQKTFIWVLFACTALAAGYVAWVIVRVDASARRVQAQMQETSLPTARPNELEAIQSQPHLLFLNQQEPYLGQAKLVGLDPALSQGVQTTLTCGRIYYAGGHGICLMYDTSLPAQDPLAPLVVWVTLFGSDLTPRHKFPIDGILSRARVSPDGKYAAFTVFVNGHSYSDPNMSTTTLLLDAVSGVSLGNLEEFETWKDGKLYQAPNFNFWGVTFAQDSNRFYATLRNGNTTYLVQGDVAARRMTVLHEGVECPSLSPDETRIAFKKLIPPGNWQLTVLDLATMTEIPLAEEESIDDQVEWLDNQRILYQKIDYDPPTWLSIFVVRADGSGKPEVYMRNAASPVVVR
jgi:hypothetical protein